MQMAANLLIQASEILFVGATGNCDIENHKLFFFVTQSSIDGIAVGCVIITTEKKRGFPSCGQKFNSHNAYKNMSSSNYNRRRRQRKEGTQRILANCYITAMHVSRFKMSLEVALYV